MGDEQKSPKLHEDHRQRMKNRLANNADSLSRHELLEILLFYAIPRKNVNPLAHILVDRFVTLDNVLHATEEELLGVEGVGKNTADFLVCVGKIADRIEQERTKTPGVYSYHSVREYLISFYKSARQEFFVVFFLDSKRNIIAQRRFTSDNSRRVLFDMKDLTSSISALKPAGVVITHNHPSGNPSPSDSDIATTRRIFALLRFTGVRLFDHIIVSDDSAYSFFYEGMLEKIEKSVQKAFYETTDI